MHTNSNHQEPILLSVPESFESDRLLIRAPLFGDGAALNEAIAESIAELRPWMPWAQEVPSVQDSEINVRQARLAFLERKDLRLHFINKNTGEFIGSGGLHRIDWKARKFEIGYWLRTSCTKQGYMTEAVAAITKYAIEHLEANRIEIRCDARNLGSAQVAERSGFTLEGILRNEVCDVDGALCSTKVFAKVRGVEF
ncbi:Ribosomal-protein-serine acetyltransferase [compost metagenome]